MPSKRAIEPFRDSPQHTYYVFPTSHCSRCKYDFSSADTKSYIESIIFGTCSESYKLRINNEIDKLKICGQCRTSSLEVVLRVYRKQKNNDGIKSKCEELGEYPFYGQFTLFDRLYRIIDNCSGNNVEQQQFEEHKNWVEIKNYNLDHRLIKLDVIDLRLLHQDVFWNLVYRFGVADIDYRFMCPYEVDLPHSKDDHEILLESKRIQSATLGNTAAFNDMDNISNDLPNL